MPAMRAAARAGRRLYFDVDIHWNGAGHEVAARSVADFMDGVGVLR